MNRLEKKAVQEAFLDVLFGILEASENLSAEEIRQGIRYLISKLQASLEALK